MKKQEPLQLIGVVIGFQIAAPSKLSMDGVLIEVREGIVRGLGKRSKLKSKIIGFGHHELAMAGRLIPAVGGKYKVALESWSSTDSVLRRSGFSFAQKKREPTPHGESEEGER